MQAWALQSILQEMGHAPVTVDRQPDKRNIFIELLRPYKPFIFRALKKKAPLVLKNNEREYVYEEMNKFVSENLVMTEAISSTSALKKHYSRTKYDAVIVGSDQVWRPKYSPNIYNFFLDFLDRDEKKISYAASFGVDDWEFGKRQTKACRKLVQRYDAISVREKSAIDLCRRYLGVNAQLVLDPTLLVNLESYKKLCAEHLDSEKSKGNILTYILDQTSHKESVISEVTSSLDRPSFVAQPIKSLKQASAELKEYNVDAFRYPPVKRWVASFYEASFIVTDSFHGCVFSIIFNKPFIAIGNRSRGLSRFQSLLSLFGLEDRLVLSRSDSVKGLLKQEIDWAEVNSRLNSLREASLRFIQDSLD